MYIVYILCVCNVYINVGYRKAPPTVYIVNKVFSPFPCCPLSPVIYTLIYTLI